MPYRLIVLLALFPSAGAFAETAAPSNPAAAPDIDVSEPGDAVGPAFEANVLWPFFPGGLVDFRIVVPAVNRASAWRGELVAGVFSDFAWRFVRDDTYGRVASFGTKLGYRQFLPLGFQVESVMQLNWRHEEDRPEHPEPLDGFQGRLWLFGGYHYDVTPRVYLNGRGGLGVHVFRTDELGDREKKLVPAADLNLGFRF